MRLPVALGAPIVALGVLIVALAPRPTRAEDMPKALLPELIATEHALCRTSVGYGQRFVQFVDVRGDGRRGVLLDYSDAMCGGVPQSFCDGSGCLIRVYANDKGAWRKVYDGHARGWRVEKVEGKAALTIDGKRLGG
jgi:hypothetical protein